jgi:cyclopropane fatty-acyl-phospholipid synthase-like methyltransferase
MKNDLTINYYNEKTQDFIDSTVNVDFTATQDKFINKLQTGCHILDFGCGSGRDSKYFVDKGFQVTAIDGSIELCKFASELTGLEVKQMYFQDLCDVEVYDAIWACSSILHLPYSDLKDVMLKMIVALKQDGIIYTSFKYGNSEGMRNGRYFTDMDNAKFDDFISQYPNITVEELWVTGDVRPERSNEQWLNVILRKK